MVLLVKAMVLATLWTASSSADLHVLGLFPMTGVWNGGQTLLTAVRMAIEDINNRKDVLPGYNITLTWTNTACNPGVGVRAMTDHLYNGPTKIMMIGGACSTVSEATSKASYLWNLTQISYASSSPALSDKSVFPWFMRLCASDTATTRIRIQMFHQLGWTKVSTLYQANPTFSLVNDALVEALHEANITLVSSQIFSQSPLKQLSRLKKEDARIIVGGFYADKARVILCESYRINLVYPRVIWIMPSWFDVGWWNITDPSITCTPEEMARAAEGIFYTGILYTDPYDTPSVSGIRPSEFILRHWRRNGNRTLPGDITAPQGYDVMWTVALGLNATLTRLIESGNTKRLEDFTYKDLELGSLMHNSMMNLSFQGLLGPVTFDSHGNPNIYVTLQQIQDSKRVTISNTRQYATGAINMSLAMWLGGVPPPDGVITTIETLTLTRGLVGFLSILAALGLLLALAFLAFNIYHRNLKCIKMSSPSVNNIILIGCVTTYFAVFVRGLDPEISCKGELYPAFLGWSLMFGSLLSKTWRVHSIFTNIKLQKKVMKDGHLFMMVGGLTLFILTILVCWSVIDPPHVEWKELDREDYDGDITIYMAASCYSKYTKYFQNAVTSVKALLLMFGAFLAFETRNVKIEALNDSKSIAVCIYNSLVLGLLHIITHATVTMRPDMDYGISAAIYIASATTVQCLIFIPKVSQYRQHRLHPELDKALTTGQVKTIATSDGGTVDDKLKQKDKEIATLMQEIERLKVLVQCPLAIGRDKLHS